MTNSMRHIIQVDDDPSHNLLCKAVIKRVFADPKVDAFLSPEEALTFIGKEFARPTVDYFMVPEDALKYIESEYGPAESNTSVLLFLDINMPSMSGWEFLDEFKKFPEHIRKQFTIYMLSSSVDLMDKERASACEIVTGFISKPLKQDTLKKLFFPLNDSYQPTVLPTPDNKIF